MSARLRLILGLALSVLGLVAVARSVDPAEVASALTRANYAWLVLTFAVVMCAVWLRSLRWRLLFVERADLRVPKLFSILMIGYLINTVLPARLGDPARAILIGEMQGVRPALALATIVVERLLDVLTVLLLLVVVLPFVNLPAWMSQSAIIMGVAAVAGFATVVLLGWHRERVLPFVTRLALRLSDKRRLFVTQQSEHLLSGADALARPGNAAAVGLLSALIWLASVFQTYTAMLAFDIPAPLGAAALVVVVNALGMVVPSSPGYVGVFHYLTVITLALFGVDASLAFSYAIVLHLVTFVPLSLFGVVYLWRDSLSLARVSSRASRLDG